MASHGCWFEWIWNQLREMLLVGSLREFSGGIRWGREALAQGGSTFCWFEGKAGLLSPACLPTCPAFTPCWWIHGICMATAVAILHWNPGSLVFQCRLKTRGFLETLLAFGVTLGLLRCPASWSEQLARSLALPVCRQPLLDYPAPCRKLILSVAVHYMFIRLRLPLSRMLILLGSFIHYGSTSKWLGTIPVIHCI